MAKLKYCFDWSVSENKKVSELFYLLVFCLVFLFVSMDFPLSVIKFAYLNKIQFHSFECVDLSGLLE